MIVKIHNISNVVTIGQRTNPPQSERKIRTRDKNKEDVYAISSLSSNLNDKHSGICYVWGWSYSEVRQK